MFKKPHPPLVITHIPKTAGTSLRHYLKSILGERLVLNYRIHPVPHPQGFRKLMAVLGYQRALLPWNAACVIGHFPSTQYDEILPTARHAIWFRNPVERIISAWEYLRRNPDMAEVDWSGVSLLEFAELEQHRNGQYKRAAGRPLDHFEMVGISEQFELSLHLFAKIFHFAPPVEIPRLNVNPRPDRSRLNLSLEDRQLIVDWNLEDVRIYRSATQRFQTLCQNSGFEIDNSNVSIDEVCTKLAEAA